MNTPTPCDPDVAVQQLSHLVREGFRDWGSLGDIAVVEAEGLLLFNYTQRAQESGRWNGFELASRGLIIDARSGEVVARPFDKFFNWGEGDRASPAAIVSVTEKIDGSLGILYRRGNTYHIATRGSFDSPQARRATTLLHTYHLPVIPEEWTLLFEIVYPENRVVVDYGARHALFLLAARNRFNGEYVPRHTLIPFALYAGFPMPESYEVSGVDDILAQLPRLSANEEGYVVTFADGQRFKFKGEKYREMHRLISAVTFRNVLATVAAGTFDDCWSLLPEAYLARALEYKQEIECTVSRIAYRATRALMEAPREDRKTFALWVQAHHRDLAPYLFALYDGKEVRPVALKIAFRNRREDTPRIEG